jgi:hypothetical protein
MDKEDQIRAVAMAIQELSSLIIDIATHPDYTMEQAASYYKTIVEMHDITPRAEEPEDEEE